MTALRLIFFLASYLFSWLFSLLLLKSRTQLVYTQTLTSLYHQDKAACIDVVLRQINQRLRKLEKSDSEKTEEIGRLNRVINHFQDVLLQSGHFR